MVEAKILTSPLEILQNPGQSSSDLYRSCLSDDLAGAYSHKSVFQSKPLDGLTNLELIDSKNSVTEKSVPAKVEPHKSADKAHPVSATLATQAHQNGFTIKVVNGKYEYHHKVNGVDEVAFTTDGSKEEAEKQFHILVEKKEAELTAKYGVQFSQAGDQTKVKNPVDDSESQAVCREPSLKELEALDAALSANKYSPDGKQGPALPKFYFLPTGKVKGFDAVFDKDDAGQPAIFVYPSMLRLPTFDDRYGAQVSMQERFNHELNHWAHFWQDHPLNGKVGDHAVPATSDTGPDSSAPTQPVREAQEKLNHPPDKGAIPTGEAADKTANGSDHKPPADEEPEDTAAEKARYERLGWREVTEVDGTKAWAIKGTDGHLYRCYELPNGKNDWIMVDEQGVPIDKHGKRIVDPQQKIDASWLEAVDKHGTVLTPYGMWFLMKPQPMTFYFTSPEEEISEAEGYYHSKNGRHLLAENSWGLYLEAKSLDQERINEVSGVGPDGQPLFIRSPDGKIVPNDAEHRAEVAAFEAAAHREANHAS